MTIIELRRISRAPSLILSVFPILPDEHVTDITFIRNEMQGATSDERGGVIDIICQNSDGTRFITDMQRAGQRHFRERTSYYVSLATRDAIARGQDWDNAYFCKVYVIAFLCFDVDNIIGFDGDVLRHYVMVDSRRGERMPGELLKNSLPVLRSCFEIIVLVCYESFSVFCSRHSVT